MTTGGRIISREGRGGWIFATRFVSEVTASVEKKKNESGSFHREYEEKRDVVTLLAVDTQRASEYADENESTHIKWTE